LLASAESAAGLLDRAENALALLVSAEAIDALSDPAALSLEPSWAAAVTADWSPLGLLASERKAAEFWAMIPEATWRLWYDDGFAVSALNELAFAASAEKAAGFELNADIAFESAASAEKADAAPDIAGTFAALAASLLNAEKLREYLLNSAALAAIADKAAG